jgi:molybdopterin-binding protein
MNCSISNVFKCSVDSVRNDKSFCIYAKSSDNESVRFTVPVSDMMFQHMKLNTGDECYVMFHPDNVYLFTQDTSTWTFSSSNVYNGSIQSIKNCKENVVVNVQVADNVIIKAKVSQFIAEQMNLQPDIQVCVVVKANQIMVARQNKE